jgi:CelD/BcsL family acetyltransferase involved in cellulose biosynthesis
MSDAAGGWDAIVLPQFSEDSPTLQIFQDLAEKNKWLTGVWSGPASPFIPLRCDYDTLFSRLKPREQHNLRKRFAKLSAMGDVRLEVVSAPSQAVAAMRDGLQIEAAAWKGQAGTAMESDNRVRRFYIQLAERAAELGQLQLSFLRVGGKRVAFFYLLESGDVVHAIKVGYDPDFRVYSPGHMLLMLILKQACDQNHIEFDFQGTAERWKLVWTTESRRYPWLFMFRDRWRSRLLHRAKFVLLPAFRNLRRTGNRT